MSIEAMSWAIKDVRGVDYPGKLLLIVLANYAGDDWSCYPSQATLALGTGMGKRTVTTWLAKLEEQGYIRREPRFKPGVGNRSGGRISDIIHIIQKTPTPDLRGVHEERGPPSASGVPPLAPVAHEPLELNHQKEPSKATVVSLPSEERRAFDRWNELAERHGWPKATAYTDVRRGHIKARIKDAGGLEAWFGFVGDIENSPFLMGRRPGRHGAFTISLDFILQPASWTKLMDGFYHRDRTATLPPGGGVSRHQERRSAFVAGALAAADRAKGERGWPGGS